MIVVNTAVGVAQEVKADRAITALSAHGRARGAGAPRWGPAQVPAAEVVVGDLLVLAEGDIVPADAAVVESAALLVDESALTGESVPVDKVSGTGDPEQPGDLVSAGTVVVRGRGRAVVTATGAASAMGQIAALMATGPALTPLQRRLVGVGRVLAVAAVALCAVVLAIGPGPRPAARADGGHRDQPRGRRRAGVAAGGGHPRAGAGRPADGRPARADPPAAGRGDAGLGDRAGHRQDRHPDRGIDVRGPAVDPHVARRPSTAPATPRPEPSTTATGSSAAADAPDVTELLTRGACCATTRACVRPSPPDGPWTMVGDPTEAALLAAAGKLGLDQTELARQLPADRRAAVRQRPQEDDHRAHAARRPDTDRVQGRPGSPAHPDTCSRPTPRPSPPPRGAPTSWPRDGYRVLAVAAADRPRAGPPTRRTLEQGLELLGLIALADPVRPAAAATIAACQAAGITPVLITGDHPATARAVATAVGIIGADDAGRRLPHADRRRPAPAHRRGCSRGPPRRRSSTSSRPAATAATWSR